MASLIVRGRCVVRGAAESGEADVLEDGAVFQENGTIVEVGPFRDLSARYRPDEVLGSEDHVVLPGLINSHHHVGLTPFQMGVPDLPLELWFAPRMGAREVDPYLDTLHSAIEMVESGITTVHHLNDGRTYGPVSRIEETARAILKAYEDVGMRVVYSFGVKDQNRLVYGPDEAFVATLPPDIAPDVSDNLRAQTLPLEEQIALVESLDARYRTSEKVRIVAAPANFHWCSDRALEALRDLAECRRLLLHMHLLETVYQKEYARRRTGTTAVAYLDRLGLLGPDTTLAHCVWVTEADIDTIARTGTRVCHLAGSNLRLQSGTAPLNAMLARGVCVAIGIDEAGINDDRDIFQEMRLVLNLHRIPAMGEQTPTAARVLRMATENAAATTPFAGSIGALRAGMAADLTLLRFSKFVDPWIDPAVPMTDAVVVRGRPAAVETVVVAGEPILRDGRLVRVRKEDVLREIRTSLERPLGPEERRRREVAGRLLPFLRKFYEGYLPAGTRRPFHETNARE